MRKCSNLLKDLQAPGERVPREQRVGARNRSLPQLLNAERLAQLGERDRAEKGGAECGHVEREVGLGAGALAHAVFEPPASVVPLAYRVADLEHARPSPAVRTA